MELKVFNKIEQAPEIEQFQSHLYGIESALVVVNKETAHVSIAPLWN